MAFQPEENEEMGSCGHNDTHLDEAASEEDSRSQRLGEQKIWLL